MRHMFVTGASSGIGKAIAMAAAKQGLAVSFTGIEAPEEMSDLCDQLRAIGASNVSYFQADFTDGDQARAVVTKAYHAQGRLDHVVNNAGIQHVASVEAFPTDAWDRVIAVNLSAAFHVTAAALPYLREADYGRIVNIASVHGLVASVNKAAYVAAKHGLIGLTKTVALETAGTNITCNAICPGWVRTPLVEAQIAQRAKTSGKSIEEEARLLVGEKQPSATFVLPEEIADMVMFLTSQKGAKITGSHFVMDGGWTAQ